MTFRICVAISYSISITLTYFYLGIEVAIFCSINFICGMLIMALGR